MNKFISRKSLSIVLAVAMLITSIFSMQVSASTANVNITGQTEANCGEEVTYSVELSGNPGFAGYNISIIYDANAFEFVSGDNGDYSVVPDITPADGIITAAGMVSSNVNGDGVLITITLKAKDNFSAETNLEVKVNELFDEDINDIPVTGDNIAVSIKRNETSTTESTTEKVTETTTERITQTTTERPTQTVTENDTETTTERATQTVTENDTETTTRRVTTSGGGAGASSLTVNGYTATTTTEAVTEETTNTGTDVDTEKTTGEVTEENSAISSDVKVTIGSKNVVIGDKNYKIDAAPYIQSASNSTLVPLRFVALAIAGGSVENADNSSMIKWNSVTKTAEIIFDSRTIQITAGSNVMTVDGKSKIMDNGVKAEIKEGRMFVPFRALGEAMGVNVDWDPETKTAVYRVR